MTGCEQLSIKIIPCVNSKIPGGTFVTLVPPGAKGAQGLLGNKDCSVHIAKPMRSISPQCHSLSKTTKGTHFPLVFLHLSTPRLQAQAEEENHICPKPPSAQPHSSPIPSDQPINIHPSNCWVFLLNNLAEEPKLQAISLYARGQLTGRSFCFLLVRL